VSQFWARLSVGDAFEVRTAGNGGFERLGEVAAGEASSRMDQVLDLGAMRRRALVVGQTDLFSTRSSARVPCRTGGAAGVSTTWRRRNVPLFTHQPRTHGRPRVFTSGWWANAAEWGPRAPGRPACRGGWVGLKMTASRDGGPVCPAERSGPTG